MKSIPDQLSPDEVWARLRSAPALGAEVRELTRAVDHVLAEEFSVPEDIPPWDRSFMDGYAVRSVDVASVPVTLRLGDQVRMGEMPARGLSAREAIVVPTGAFLPAGCDAVVMQEDAEIQNGSVVIKKSVRSGENVQKRGEDYKKGDVLFRAFHRLRPQDLAALATFGITRISVYRRPTVRTISTGNELVDYQAQPDNPARIRETNALTLTAAAQKFGFLAISDGIVRDEFDLQRRAVESALEHADVILVSGGSSVGQKDFTREVITSFPQHRIYFHGISIRPGNPTIFASVGSRYIFGLPGQPVSSLIVFYQFVLPFLFHLSGEQFELSSFHQSRFVTRTVPLARELLPLRNKTDYFRVRLEPDGGNFRAVPVPGKSASLSTLTRADGFIIIPPGSEPLTEGTPVTVFLFP